MVRVAVFIAAIYFALMDFLPPTIAITVPYFPSQVAKESQNRLSVSDWQSYQHDEPEGPGTYAFGYDIEEPQDDNVQYRHEERHANGTVTGSYGFVSPEGNVHIVNYIADARGYRANTETRTRGVLKPVVVNEEQDIADAIAAANFAKTKEHQRLSSADEHRMLLWNPRFGNLKTRT